MDHVVDFVCFQGENLAKSSSDFVLESHGFEGERSIDFGVDVGSGDDDWVEVVVSELSCLSGFVVGVSENSSVGVPLSDG